MIDIQRKRAAAQRELADLEAERGRAALLDKQFDDIRIIKIEQKLTALGEAEVEARRQEAAAAVSRNVDFHATRAAEVAAIEAARLEALGRAEAAAHELGAALAEVLGHAAELRRLIPEAANEPTFMSENHRARLAGHTAAALEEYVAPNSGHFGGLNLRGVASHGTPTPATGWAQSERAAFAGMIDLVRKKADRVAGSAERDIRAAA